MSQDAVKVMTLPGRMVWGSLTERAANDYYGKPYEAGKGPYQYGLAFRKDAPGAAEFLQKFYGIATAGYHGNQVVLNQINAEWQSGFSGKDFAFKIKDGDRPSKKTGKVNPNTAGHWVLSISTTIESFKCCNAQNVEIDPGQIVPGYFIDSLLGVKPNGAVGDQAGIYLNPLVVRLLAEGDKIVGGESMEELAAQMSAAPTQLPAGARPVTSAMAGMPAAPAMPAPNSSAAPAMPGLPTGQPAVPTMPSPGNAGPAPHTAFVNNALPLPGM